MGEVVPVSEQLMWAKVVPSSSQLILSNENGRARNIDYWARIGQTFPSDEFTLGFHPRDFLDVHIAAQLEAKPGSTFHGLTGQQNEEIVLLGNYHRLFSLRHLLSLEV